MGVGGRRMGRDNSQFSRDEREMNWNREVENSGPGHERGRFADFGSGNQGGIEMHGNRERQVAAFGSQGPRSGGNQSSDWQRERGFRDGREDGRINHPQYREEREREWQGGSGW